MSKVIQVVKNNMVFKEYPLDNQKLELVEPTGHLVIKDATDGTLAIFSPSTYDYMEIVDESE